MKKLLTFLFSIFIGCVSINAQTVLTYQGQTYNDTQTDVSNGINVPRDVPTTFSFLNNSVTAVNSQGYMLQAGDEGVSYGTNGNLNGELISGNKFTWNGNFDALSPSMVITHGVFTGCNIDVNIKYNYLYKVPMGIIRKSGSSMTNTKGGVFYNIVKTFNVGAVEKGMNNVNWYNNTFYNDRTTTQTYRPCIDIYENTDVTPTAAAHGAKVKNNIFYTKYKTPVISITTDSRIGFECDYNLYWCEEGDHTPVFNVGGSTYTWTQWKALGYDTHSVNINPNFNNITDFVPSARLNYGTDLGTAFNTGLATNATWTVNSAPATQVQNGTWQVGARVYASAVVVVPPTVTTTAISSIGTTTANSGGNVTSDGGATVTERGVCWDMSGGPALDNPHTHDGTGTGSFTSNITGLSPNTTYYVEAYATNSAGTSYGNLVSFKTTSTTTTITIEGQTVNDSNNPVDDNYAAVRIDNSIKAQLYYRNNSITSINQHGYMLDAGDESVLSTNNNLDGAVITGNKFTWNGTQTGSVITHGLFTGYNINDVVKYNYLTNVPYGIIIKSGSATSNMTNTTGGVSYNIVKNGRFSGRVKGINGTKYYNNTFYGDANSWYHILITSNSDNGTPFPSTGTKIKNNIFYTITKIPSISIELNSLTGFECDYNVYWCEAGDNTPIFTVEGVSKTWTQWKALGYDAHSIVINPNFNNTTDFVPAVRLDYGTDLGTDFNTGLATTATWTVGSAPATQAQNGTWQVGARVYTSSTPYAGPIWYVATNGSNTTGDGSPIKPWASLSYACTKVTTAGHTIIINAGTSYIESGQILLSNGVTIKGAGKDITRIKLLFATSYPCLKLETPNGWGNTAYGNQSITGITFDGDLTGLIAIGTNFRSNVDIHDCDFVNFVESAVFFNGEPTYVWTLDNPYNNYTAGNTDYPYMPDANGWCTGNKLYNSTVTNCSKMLSYSATGAICLGTQDGFVMHDVTINSTARSGFGLKFWDLGFTKNCDISYNDITISPIGTGHPFEFGVEWWWSFGGDRFYNNRIRGSFDIVNSVDNYSVGYSVKAYNNNIGRDTTPSTLERGFLLEGVQEHTQLLSNYVHHVARAVYIPRGNFTGKDRLFHVDINTNLFVKLGQTGTNYQTWGVYYPDYSDEAESQYLKIQNNVFEADNSLSTISMFGIQLPNVSKQSYIYTDNNIILNFDEYPIFASGARTKADNIFVRNNLSYNNGNNNLPYYDAAFRNSLTNYTETNNLIANPLFVSSNDYHLADNSPAIGKGIWVDLTTDIYGVQWKKPPSIGACESTTSLPIVYVAPSPTGNDATGDGSITKPWFTLNKAWENISAGYTVYMRGGTYNYLQQQNLYDKNGTATDSIRLFAYPNEKPIISRGTPFTYPQWP
jgi:hypothetical protein